MGWLTHSYEWHWLFSVGFSRDIVSSCVGATVASLVAWLPWKRHKERQLNIEDKLNTQTPGGLTDIKEKLDTLTRPVPVTGSNNEDNSAGQ